MVTTALTTDNTLQIIVSLPGYAINRNPRLTMGIQLLCKTAQSNLGRKKNPPTIEESLPGKKSPFANNNREPKSLVAGESAAAHRVAHSNNLLSTADLRRRPE